MVRHIDRSRNEFSARSLCGKITRAPLGCGACASISVMRMANVAVNELQQADL